MAAPRSAAASSMEEEGGCGDDGQEVERVAAFSIDKEVVLLLLIVESTYVWLLFEPQIVLLLFVL